MKIVLVFLAGIIIGALIVGAVWRSGGHINASAEAETAEVRISARKVLGGDIEFALQQRHAGGWGERQLARARFFPGDRTEGGWLNSSPYTVAFERVLYVRTSEVDGFEIGLFGEPERDDDVAVIEAAVRQSVRHFLERDGVSASNEDLRFHFVYDLDTWLEHTRNAGDPVAERKLTHFQWLSAWGGDFNTTRVEGAKAGLIMVYANPNLDLYDSTTLVNARATIRHEYVHALQFHLSEGRWLSGRDGVPAWFYEGQAHLETAEVLRTDPEWGNIPIEEMRRWAEDCTAPVVHYTDANPCAYQLGPLAIDWLANEFGMDAVWNVWRRVAAGDVWPTVFRRAFGISVEQFSQRFERHRDSW